MRLLAQIRKVELAQLVSTFRVRSFHSRPGTTPSVRPDLQCCLAPDIPGLAGLGFACECIKCLQAARPPRREQQESGDCMASADDLRTGPDAGTWRTPLVIVVCGCLIGMLTFGPRSTFGFFMQPMSREFAWGRDVFGLALAVQNLLWGIAQPVAGAMADRFGSLRVISVGALMYAAGIIIIPYAATPLSLDISAGVLIGLGLSGCSFNLVLSAFGKLMPPEWRGVALGAGTAAGSFGQFVFAPFGVAMLDNFGWPTALMVFAGLMLLVVPLSLALATPPSSSSGAASATQEQTFKHALAEAFGHRSYVLLVLGFFTCGFQL